MPPADPVPAPEPPPATSARSATPRRASVVALVPAHQEEASIADSVRALLAAPGVDVRVVVVPNGCTDGTADRAREVTDPRVEVVELAEPGKTRALHAGLARAPEADVLAVVDADVRLEPDVFRQLADVLDRDDATIAAPALRLALDGCSWASRTYVRVWSAEPVVRALDVSGRGLYAVNRAGRERLQRMPDILADDGWARAAFAPHERRTVAACSTVRPARTLRAQVRRVVRIRHGNLELRRVFPPAERPAARPDHRPPVPRTAFERLRAHGVAAAVVWHTVDLGARVLLRWYGRRGRAVPWGSDTTSRQKSRQESRRT